MILKALLVGWAILLFAILINFIAQRVGIWTWYDFLGKIGKNGFVGAFLKSSLFSKIFLFIVYPFILGVVTIFTTRLVRNFKFF